MNKSKPIIFSVVSIVIILTLILFSVFNKKKEKTEDMILASSFPVYLITQNLLEGIDALSLDYIASAESGCAHDYMLTTADRMKVETANIIIINGGGLEEYLHPVLKALDSTIIDSSVKISNRIYYSEDNHKEHLHAINESDHDENDHNEIEHKLAFDDEANHELNPHFFVSPYQNSLMAETIAKELSILRPLFSNQINENLVTYQLKIQELTQIIEEMKPHSTGLKIITQHSAFDYLANDLGISISAVLQDHEGTAPASSQMIELIALIKKEQIGYLFNEPGYSDEIAKTIQHETGIKIFILDPVSSGPASAKKEYYFKVMKNNFSVLQEIINGRK